MVLLKKLATGFLLLFISYAATAQAGDVFEVIVSTSKHSKFVKSLNTTSLVNTLKTGTDLTVFAPTNEAFAKLSKGKSDSLARPELKDMLAGIVGYHIVAGRFDAAKLIDKMKKEGGEMQLLTITGKKLTLMLEGDKIKISDGTNAVATVTTADLSANNGIVHVVDGVAFPK